MGNMCDDILKADLIGRLRWPQGPVDVVLDTDACNEIDDQYALAYLIKSDDKLKLKAIYAAPFDNKKSNGPADGMEKSFAEIGTILSLMGRKDLEAITYYGSQRFLPAEDTPVESPAARDLIRRAMSHRKENPLYVIAIAAITNVASALLLAPEIKERIVLVWLGGNAHDWPDTHEFNMFQDIAAARVVFGCGVPLVQLPCMGVVSGFTTTRYELEHWLKNKNKLCDYLADITIRECGEWGMGPCWSKPIWDVAAVAWLIDEDFMLDRFEHSPIPQYDSHYSIDPTRHFIRYVYHINRDKLFEDLVKKLTA